ncbi:MAG: hypothetical protein ACLQRH_28560 [Acidimicrobiales bacterium]
MLDQSTGPPSIAAVHSGICAGSEMISPTGCANAPGETTSVRVSAREETWDTTPSRADRR